MAINNEDYDFFNPNICHICKKSTILRECPSCRIVYYCNEQHEEIFREEHKDFCKATLTLKKQRNIYNDRVIPLEAWVKFQEENMRSVREILGRNLHLDEKEMFLLAKSCFVCHRQEEVYEFCKQCLSVNVCLDHNLSDAVHACSQLKHTLELDKFVHRQDGLRQEIWRGFMSFDKRTVSNMNDFIKKVIQSNRTETKWTMNDYVFTDNFSLPLTLLYAMKQAQIRQESDSFVVYIISGNNIITDNRIINNHNLVHWEVVLHEFRRGTIMKIVSIGTEYDNKRFYCDLCSICTMQSRILKYESYCLIYHHICKNMLYGTPNVIIALDMELRREKEATAIIKKCKAQRCPLLLTAKSKIKADDNVMMIRKILDLPLDPFINEKNKFQSFKPFRNYENNSVFYPNEYITFYKNLDDPNWSVQGSSSSSGV